MFRYLFRKGKPWYTEKSNSEFMEVLHYPVSRESGWLLRYTPFGKIKAHGGKKHADLYLCFRGNVCPDGKTKAGAAARAGRHCKGDPCQYLLQRSAYQARQRAPGGARHHGRARDGGHRRRSGQCGDQCETRRPGDGERGDLLRRVLFLQKKAS